MKTYLRLVNPVIALAVLLLCLWAAAFDDSGHFKPTVMFAGGIPTYFLAKGLFCSSALFLMGKILSVIMGSEKQ
jgi:hypothetical protein